MLESGTDVLIAIAVSVFGLGIVIFCAQKAKVSFFRASMLYLWHSVFAYIYADLIFRNGGDALWYYQSAIDGHTDFSTGSAAVINFTGITAYWLNFSFFETSLIFHIFGTIGLIFFDSALSSTVANKERWIKTASSFIVFLPSASFWSSGLGKDSISFFGIGLLLWASQDLQKRMFSVVLALAVVFLVRPHIGIALIGCFAASVFIARGGQFWIKAGLGIVGLIVLFFAAPFVAEKIGLNDLSSVAELDEYIDNRQNSNLGGGSSIEISNLSVPMRLFSYMFRPLFTDGGGGMVLAASVENTILLMAVVAALIGFVFNSGKSKENVLFLLSYVLSSWLLLANTTSNLGIATRQKWMILPFLIVLLLSVQKNQTAPRTAFQNRRAFT